MTSPHRMRCIPNDQFYEAACVSGCLGFLVPTKDIARNGFYVSHRCFRCITQSPILFRYLDMLWPLNPVWPPSAIMDCRIRGILFLIRKLMDLIYPHANFFQKKSPLTWTVLNSYKLLEVVNLSGSRHLRFLVSTQNTDSNDFYVSHIFLEVSHIPLWCLDTDICYGLKI